MTKFCLFQSRCHIFYLGVSQNSFWPKTENRNFDTETKTISVETETETEFSAENGKIGVKMGFSDFFL